jgi:corrinoid protein of di/trimethylamine methyltransferase
MPYSVFPSGERCRGIEQGVLHTNHIERECKNMKTIDRIVEATVAGDIEKSAELARQVIAEGIDPMDALEKGYARAMRIVGDKFGKMEIYLPELMLSADAMKAGFEVIKPHLTEEQQGVNRGTIILGTIQGDLHDLGKNIVRTMLEASGFEVHDLGCDVPVRSYIEKAEEVEADIVAASAILTTTMVYMPDLSRILEEMGVRRKYKILVGGGPVTPEFAEEADADGYAENAAEGVRIAEELLGKSGKGDPK